MSLADRFKSWCKEGMYLPFSHDPTTNKPSVTLLFFYLGGVAAFISVCLSTGAMLVRGDYLTSTFMPVALSVLGFIFYRLRHLDKVKIDLNDQEIELSSDDEEETEGKEE